MTSRFGNAEISSANTSVSENTNTNTHSDDDLYAPEYNASNVFDVESVDNETCVDYINSLRDILDGLVDTYNPLKDKSQKKHAYNTAIENIETTVKLIEEQLTSRNGPIMLPVKQRMKQL